MRMRNKMATPSRQTPGMIEHWHLILTSVEVSLDYHSQKI